MGCEAGGAGLGEKGTVGGLGLRAVVRLSSPSPHRGCGTMTQRPSWRDAEGSAEGFGSFMQSLILSKGF